MTWNKGFIPKLIQVFFSPGLLITCQLASPRMSDLRESAQEGSHSLFITQSQDGHTINSAVFYLLKVNHKSSSLKGRRWHQRLTIRRWFEAACWWDCQPQTHVNFLPGMLKVAMLRLRGEQPKRALTWYCVCRSHSVMSNSLRPHRLWPTRLFLKSMEFSRPGYWSG